MNFDLNLEKTRRLSTQDMYDIISFAVDSAVDNGFVNSFIFGRALYLYAAIILVPDRKDEIAHAVAENINTAWDTFIADGTIEDIANEYSVELEALAEQAETWLDEFTAYTHSARGLLNTIQEFSGDIVQAAVNQLKQASSESGVQEVLNIADRWGMNNTIENQPVIEQPSGKIINSVFE